MLLCPCLCRYTPAGGEPGPVTDKVKDHSSNNDAELRPASSGGSSSSQQPASTAQPGTVPAEVTGGFVPVTSLRGWRNRKRGKFGNLGGLGGGGGARGEGRRLSQWEAGLPGHRFTVRGV